MILDSLWEEQRERTKLKKTFDRLISQARKEKNQEEADSLISEFITERDQINDIINGLETTRIQEEAERLGIPIPPFLDAESWEQGFNPNIFLLSSKARLQLCGEIRKERRRRWEDRTLWISRILLPLLALIGAMRGLVSVWKK